MAYPDTVAVKAYAKDLTASHADSVIADALKAEIAAQAAVCRVDANNLPDDLREALLRRVVRNLAMRAVPLGVQSDAVGGFNTLGSNDPEVRRLEKPHRKLFVG